MRIFSLNSPLMQKLSLLYDLIILNLLTIFCSLPVVTMGAAISALYDGVWRLRNHEGTLLRNYFQAFRSNFKQATLLFLPLLLVGVNLGNRLLTVFTDETLAQTERLLPLFLACLVWGMLMAWVFPLQSRFDNKTIRIYMNAFFCALKFLPQTLVMLLLNLLPWALWVLFPVQFMQYLLLWLLLWFAATAYFVMWMLQKPIAALFALATPSEEAEGQEES